MMPTGANSSPPRPYASPDQVPAGAEFRSDAFRTGANQAGDVATSVGQDPGLVVNQQQFQAQVGGYRPSSVLTPIGRNPGGLGMSAADAARRTFDGTYLGSINGQAESSFEPSVMLRLSAGLDAE